MDMNRFYGYYWATIRDVRDIWIACGECVRGGEPVFQRFTGHEIARLSELSNLVKIEEK